MRLFRGLFEKVDQLFTRRKIDDELFDELEEILIQADLSVDTTLKLVDELREATRKERLTDAEQVKKRLEDFMVEILGTDGKASLNMSTEPPTVYLIVGVNGVGKTTTIAKLAHKFKKQGKRVMLSAADTFRAAAIDQLDIWANRVGVDIIKHQPNADPAAVVFDSLQSARARRADILIADTAGRLHTKSNLMEELKKINRVVEREMGRKADETLLVLDATTGQNAISQAKQFKDAVDISGIVLAKLDGTAKGGIVITIKEQLGVPIKLVGLGEQLDDLQEFDPREFVEALLEGNGGEVTSD